MTTKEKLYYLLRHVKLGEYDINTFSNLFTNTVNLELKKEDCTSAEFIVFQELNKYTSRFSPFEDDLRIARAFYDEETLRMQINIAVEKLQSVNDKGTV